MYEFELNVCENCSNDKDIIVLTKETQEKKICMKCLDNQLFYDGWKHHDFEICQECSCVIDCLKKSASVFIKNVYILVKNGENKKLCSICFDELWREAYKNGWRGDDIEYEVDFHEKYF